MLDRITPLILTWNEEAIVARTLEKLAWAHGVVVVDSGSTDGTRAICESFPNVRLVVRPFDNHATQWNFGLKEAGITSDWVLALDADYVLTDAIVEEFRALWAQEIILLPSGEYLGQYGLEIESLVKHSVVLSR